MRATNWHRAALVAVAVVAGLGSAVGARHLAGTAALSNPVATTEEHDDFSNTSGHLTNSIGLTRGAQEEINLRRGEAYVGVQVENRFSEAASVRYAVELTDELGNEIAAPSASAPIEMEPGSETEIELEIPRSLRRGSGFYMFRVTAVGRAGAEVADETLEIGLAVVDGTAYPLEPEQWLEFSFANLGEQR